MKKVAVFASAAMMLVCGAAVTGCGGASSGDTYTGTVSEETYESAEKAAQGFLETEISGMAFTAVYVGYTKKAELSEKEIAKLTLKEEYAENIASAEKGTVEYTESAGMQFPYSVRAAGEEIFTRELYLLNYEGGEYRYFTPALNENDSLTTSYFAALFDIENYRNCTLKINITLTQGVNKQEVTNIWKFTKNATHMSVNVKTSGEIKQEEEGHEDILVDTANGTFSFYKETGENWRRSSGQYDSVEDCVNQLYGQEFETVDHSYFVKTSTGFKMKRGIGYESYEVKVSGGKIAEVHCTQTAMREGVKMTFSATSTYYDFGKTTVTLPDEVKALLNE